MGHRINIVCYLTSLALAYWLTDYFVPVAIVCTLLFMLVLTLGVMNISFNYFLVSIHKNDTAACTLTFDDGPHPEFTPVVLDILQRHKVKAVFFLIGNTAKQYPGLVHRILAEGHRIGNHSFSHSKWLPCFSTAKLRADLRECQNVLETISGKEVPLFRPPFGITNPNYSRALKALNLQSMGWSLRTFDTVTKDADQLYRKITSRVRQGDIILLHDTQRVTAEFLDPFITYCQQNGMFFDLPAQQP